MFGTKRKVEVFFDYACPFSRKANEFLMQLLPEFPDIQPIWRPCEAYPRPSSHELHPHSDLCIQAMFFAADQGVDLCEFHNLTFSLIHETDTNVENIDSLAAALSSLLDAKNLRRALTMSKYRQIQEDANKYAFEQSGIWTLPAYRMEGRRLDSALDIGVTLEQLHTFLKTCSHIDNYN